jgi:hypothetical protein
MMLRRRSERGCDAIPNSPQCPSRVVSSSDESSRTWQVRPLRFESQSASTSPVAQKSFNFGSPKVDVPVQKSDRQKSVHRGHRRVASASIPLADIGEALPSSSLSMSERGISEAASAASRKARSRDVSALSVCVCACVCACLRVCYACDLAPLVYCCACHGAESAQHVYTGRCIPGYAVGSCGTACLPCRATTQRVSMACCTVASRN